MTTAPQGPRTSDGHAGHDRSRIAAHAAGDLDGAALLEVEAILAGCPACAELHRDLRSIAAATRVLGARPVPAGAAGRDFRLGPETARRLRPVPAWQRVLRPLLVRDGPGRPLAAAFASLGVAGLLLASLPAGGLGLNFGSGGAAPGRDATSQGELAPSAVPTGNGAFGPVSSPGSKDAGAPTNAPTSRTDDAAATAVPAYDSGSPDGAVPGMSGDAWRDRLVIGSGFLLALGLGLVVLRRIVRAPA
jgi:hypothetical protein